VQADLILFWVFAPISVASGIGMLLMRNAVHAALFLIVNFFCLAVFYLVLGAPFLFAVQIIVYAGAIMVLFLFVIMLLNLGHTQSDIRGPSGIATALVIVGLLLVELLALIRYNPRQVASELANWPTFTDPATVFVAGQVAQQETVTRGVVGVVAAPLFQVYLIPFEITSILLLVAIVGAVVLAKRKV